MTEAILDYRAASAGSLPIEVQAEASVSEPSWRLLLMGLGGDAAGRLAERLDEGEVIGVDPSPAMHRLAQRRHWAALQAGRLKLLISPIERLPLPQAWVDAVTIVDALQLASSAAAAARELARVTRPGAPVGCVTHAWALDAQGLTASRWLDAAGDAFEASGFEDVGVAQGSAGGEAALMLRARRAGEAASALATPRRFAA